MLAVLSVAFTLVLPACSLQAKFQKCCPFGQQLDVSFQRCVNRTTPEYENYLVSNDSTDSRDRYPRWLLKNATVLSSDTRQPIPGFFGSESFLDRVKEGGWKFCGSSLAMVLVDPGDFAYLDDGSLVVYSGGGLLPPLSSCADRVALPDEDVEVVTVCPCAFLPCLRKCCPEGYSLNMASGKSRCVVVDAEDSGRTWRVGFTEGRSSADFAAVYGTNFCDSVARLYEVDGGATRSSVVQEDGSLELAGGRGRIPRQQFCVDGDHVLACGSGLQRASFRLYGALSVLGAAFLAATLLVQALLPQRGGHARQLVAHTSSLLVTYIALSAGQLSSYLPPAVCYIVAFTIQFSFLAAIFWLNVMCIDIAWSFSGFHVPRGSYMKCQMKRFRLYSLYAWGSCVIISLATMIMEFSPQIPETAIRPEFGRKTCWFGSHTATLAYFYGPVSCLLLGNLVLFIYTVVRILKMRRSTAVLRQSESAYHRGKIKEEEQVKKRFMLYLKLFCLMGVTWTTEVISWAVDGPSYYWYITDIINVFRAVFIFVIFCCKREVMKRVQLRMNLIVPWCVPKPTRAQEKECSFSGHTDSSRCTTKCSTKSTRKKSSNSNVAETST